MATADEDRAVALPYGSRKPSILVVDDESALCELCPGVLKECRVFCAANGEEALRVLDSEEIDVILTDVMMPGMSGLDLLGIAKEREPNRVVIIMTGYSDREIVLRALKAGADDFISKPINLLQLRTVIDKTLERKALREELLHLKYTDRLKTDFLGLVSHKLKTPVTVISLFLQNLARGIGDIHDPAFVATLRLILEESGYLGDLIQELLTFSDMLLQDGPPDIRPSDLAELAVTVLDELSYLAADKKITLDHQFDGSFSPLLLDRRRIAFAIRALLHNAIKFSPRGGTVTLGATIDAETVRLEIRDNGPGIPAEELLKVFEKFYQIDPGRTGQVQGFGLGLFYARSFIRDHGGRLQLMSSPGTGTTAVITLPRR